MHNMYITNGYIYIYLYILCVCVYIIISLTKPKRRYMSNNSPYDTSPLGVFEVYSKSNSLPRVFVKAWMFHGDIIGI